MRSPTPRAEAAREPANVLVVDDEPSILDVVASVMALAGHAVTTAATGTQALALARARSFDLVVLDVNLPDRDGFEIVDLLRAEGRDVPVLFLTARTEPASAVEGLSRGGDDYLRKPFDLDELSARAHALLRRRDSRSTPSVVSYRDVIVDHNAFVARRGERILALTPTELRLLDVLVRHGGRVLTKAQLVDLVWDDPAGVDLATVETAISRLRRKLDVPPDAPLLTTRRGVGYGLIDSDS